MGADVAPDDEVWTTGRIARELADLGIRDSRQVSRMIESGELAGVRRAPGKWAHARAGDVRAYRERVLAGARRQPAPGDGQ